MRLIIHILDNISINSILFLINNLVSHPFKPFSWYKISSNGTLLMPSKTNRLHNITVHTDNSTINTFYPVAFCGASSINRTDIIDILVFGYNFIESNACLSLINTPICLTTFSADRTASCRTGLIRGIRYQLSLIHI